MNLAQYITAIRSQNLTITTSAITDTEVTQAITQALQDIVDVVGARTIDDLASAVATTLTTREDNVLFVGVNYYLANFILSSRFNSYATPMPDNTVLFNFVKSLRDKFDRDLNGLRVYSMQSSTDVPYSKMDIDTSEEGTFEE
jgi:hypothetical protein